MRSKCHVPSLLGALIIIYYPAKFGRHKHRGSEDVMPLFFHFIPVNHVTQEPCYSLDRSALR